jgi:hypothetical protein
VDVFGWSYWRGYVRLGRSEGNRGGGAGGDIRDDT